MTPLFRKSRFNFTTNNPRVRPSNRTITHTALGALLLGGMSVVHAADLRIITDNFVNEDVGTVEVLLDVFVDESYSGNCTISGTLITAVETEEAEAGSVSVDAVGDPLGSATEGVDYIIQNPNFSITFQSDTPEIQPTAVTMEPIIIETIDDEIVETANASEGGPGEIAVFTVAIESNSCEFPGGLIAFQEEVFIIDNDVEEEGDGGEEGEEIPGLLGERVGLNRQQRAIATALDNSCSTIRNLEQRSSEQTELLNACNELLTSDRLGRDLDQLAPSKLAPMGSLALQTAMQQTQNMAKQISRIRESNRVVDASGLTINIAGQHLSGQQLGSLLGAGAGDDGFRSDWGVFIGGSLEIGDFDNGGFDVEANNLLAGIDYRFSDSVILGAAMGYANSGADYNDNLNKVRLKGVSASVFGSYYGNNQFYIDGIASYGVSDYTTERSVVFGSINQIGNGDTDGQELSMALNTGYSLYFSKYFFNIFGSVNYVDANIDNFEERASGTSTSTGALLAIESQDLESLVTNLGLQLGWAFKTQSAVITPKLSLDWERQYKDDPRIISSRFLGDASNLLWDIETAGLDSSYYNAGFSINSVFKNGFSAFLLYETDLSRDDIHVYNVSVGSKWEF